jgi:hypothetical protein
MKTKLFSIMVLVLIAGLNVRGQTKTDTSTGIARLRFLGENNFALIPDYVEFIKRGNPVLDTIIKKENIASNGTLRIRLQKGTYDIYIYAKEYEPTFSNIEILNNSDIGEGRFYPKSKKPQITYEQFKPLLKEDTVLMDSYIIDDETRQPLADVIIYTEDRVAQGRSDKNGHYQIYIPLPLNNSEIKGRNAIYYEKENYIIVVHYDFDMWSQQFIGFSCYMKKGNGINKIDIMEGSRRKASIQTQEISKKNRDSAKGQKK